jgi:hypothetical protein
MEPNDPRIPPDPEDPRVPSFERLEVPTPVPTVTRRRTATVSTAGAVLVISGMLNLLVFALLRSEGGMALLHLLLGLLQLGAAALVLLLRPEGRWLGAVLGGAGIVLGVLQAPEDAMSGLTTIAVNAFVIYALASSGPSFARR